MAGVEMSGLVARAIRNFTQGAMSLAFPPICFACRQERRMEHGRFCHLCQSRIAREMREPACPRCGGRVESLVDDQDCAACKHTPPRIRGTVRVGPYGEHLGLLGQELKYDGREELLDVFVGELLERLSGVDWLDKIDAVVAVPSHWSRRIEQPWYVAKALADELASCAHLAHLSILRRVRAGPHQIGLSYAARRVNVKGAFAVHRGVSMNRARLLLVDDVRTTGATLEECAKVLHKAGAAEVYAAVILQAGKGGG